MKTKLDPDMGSARVAGRCRGQLNPSRKVPRFENGIDMSKRRRTCEAPAAVSQSDSWGMLQP